MDSFYTNQWELLQHLNIDKSGIRDWGESFEVMGKIDNVEKLNYMISKIKEKKLDNLNDLYFFKQGIKPMWEDSCNVNGGRLIAEFSINHPRMIEYLARTFMWAFLNSYPSIVGVAFNEKEKTNRICLWIGDCSESDDICKTWKVILGLSLQSIIFIPHKKHKEFIKINKKKSFSSNQK